jgi:hypothetical protein
MMAIADAVALTRSIDCSGGSCKPFPARPTAIDVQEAARSNHGEGSSRRQCRSRNSKRNPEEGLI